MKKNQISEIHGTSLGTCNSFSNSAQQQNETEGKKKKCGHMEIRWHIQI